MTGQHTPTPWVRRGLALEADKKIIAWIVERFDPREHNATAAFIVRAVNVHDELVAVLRLTSGLLKAISAPDDPITSVAIAEADAALIKAGSGHLTRERK